MTVQNYVGQIQNAGIDLSEIEDMIDELVRDILMDIFADEQGEITIDGSLAYYTKSEIETKLRDYLTKTLASNTYATKSSLNDYLTKTQIDEAIANIDLSAYATDAEVAEAVEALNEIVQNNYLTKTQIDEAIANIDLSAYATDAEVAEAVEALNEIVQNNYLTKTQASNTYLDKTSLDDYYNKDEVEELLANVSSGGSVDLSNYLTKTDASNTYATKTSLDNYLTESDASNTYATNSDMADEITSVRNFIKNYYYDKDEIDTKITNAGTVDLSNYLTKTDASNTYLDKTALNAYFNKNEINILISGYLAKTDASDTYASKTSLGSYYTKSEVDGLLDNVHVDLSDYYNKSQVDSAIASASAGSGGGGSVDLSAYLKKSDAALTYAKIGDFLKEPFQKYGTFDEDVDKIYPSDEELRELYTAILFNDKQEINTSIDELYEMGFYYDRTYEHFAKLYNYFKTLFVDGQISSDQLLYRCLTMDSGIKHLRTKSGASYDYTENQAMELISNTRKIPNDFDEEECSELMISNLESWSAGGNLGLDGYWHDVAFGHGVFVAVGYTRGYAGVASYSTTAGKTWTPSTGAILTTNAYWQSVTYGKGRFVALATTARQEGNENFIAYSNDFGKTWSLAENVPQEQCLSYITYGGGRFIALNDAWAGTDGRYMAYSDDGIKWTSNKLPEFYDVGASQGTHVNQWKTAAYGDGRWVAITNYNTSAYSEDGGITWTKGGDLPYETTYGFVAFGNHRFVAVTAMPRKTKPLEFFSIYSDDGGITWNVGGNVYDSYTNLIYANGRFIATRAMGVPIENFPHIIYSKDGITWTRKSVGTDNVDNWKGMAYGNGRVILTVSKAANPSQNTMICACSPLEHSILK